MGHPGLPCRSSLSMMQKRPDLILRNTRLYQEVSAVIVSTNVVVRHAYKVYLLKRFLYVISDTVAE